MKHAKVSLERTEKFVNEYEKQQAKGRSTRALLNKIGGVRLVLETKDKEKLDGTYLSAKSFQEKCTQAGAQSMKFSFPIDENKKTEISGLIFPANDQADEFISNLDKLSLFKDFSPDAKNKGAGWAKIQLSTGETAIIPDFQVQQLLDNNLITENQGMYSLGEEVLSKGEYDIKPLEIDSQKSGTLILGLGAAGVYEMYKREALSLLMQGVNVMLFNHRGQGESTGKPSEEGVYEDMHTVYQYLKDVHRVEDNKLMLRGLCLSGGIVSELASRYPKVNVILDQTYADISDIALNTVMETIQDMLQFDPEKKDIIKEMVLGALMPLLKAVTSLISPSFMTAKHLKEIERHIMVLRTTEDTYIGNEMTDKVLKGIKNVPFERIHVGHMPGIHGETWLDAKKNYENNQNVHLGRYHMLSFLKESGVLNPFIDGGQTILEISHDYHKYLEAHTQALKKLENFSEDIVDVPEGFTDIPLETIKEIKDTQTLKVKAPENVTNGKTRFASVLTELDRLKGRLGGSPNFGTSPPTLNDQDNKRIFLGMTMTGIKDNLRMILKKHWVPKFFWKSLANIFGANDKRSQYEEAYVRIQQFGMMIANKERFLEILKNNETDRFLELGLISGLMWHPNDNGYSIEKFYMEFVEFFLTEQFQAAKNQGDEKLIEYFNAFTGVCFEDRCRELEKFSQTYPIEGEEILMGVQEIIDIIPSQPVEHTFNEILKGYGAAKQRKGEAITGEDLIKAMKEQNIFNIEFQEGEGKGKRKPTLEDAHRYVLQQIEYMVVEPYSPKEFLDIEFQIFIDSGLSPTLENFVQRLQMQKGVNNGFDVESDDIKQIIQDFVDQGKLTKS